MEPRGRKRAFLPKVKTGCTTCKSRKLKCDETKPHCLRCTSTGRTCGGYRSSPSPPAQQVQLSMSAWLGTDLEKRSFDFFLLRARNQLGGFFAAPFWSREVLQAAIHYPSIRHLVVALGAGYEQFESRASDCLPESDFESQFALQQCNHAISQITEMAGSPKQSFENMCCILTASILFAIFSSLEEQFGQAINHVRSGMRVLSELDALKLDGAYPVPIARLRFMLTNLYSQVRAMINDEARERWNDHDPLHSEMEPVTAFISLADAESYVGALYKNTLAFFQRTELNPPSSSDHLEEIVAERNRLESILEDSVTALDALASRGTGSGEEKAVAILRLYQTLLSVQLSVHTFKGDEREKLFDAAEHKLVQMLDLCKLVLQDDLLDHGNTPRQPVYSCGLGPIAPLHMIAARCRNPAVRQEAVKLLRSARRRDWLWDSRLTENIVATTIELEREATSGYATVPEALRIREVKLHFEDDRGVHLEYITVGQWRQGKKGCRRSIQCSTVMIAV